MRRCDIYGTVTLALLIYGTGVIGQTCVPFPEVQQGSYDRDYVTIQADRGRPLGFLKSTVYFLGEQVDPCYTIQAEPGQSIEVAFETVPRMQLCYADQTGAAKCQEGRYRDCITAKAAETKFTFYCDVSQGCSESDVNFWLRLTKGPSKSNDTEGMWCMWRRDEFPEGLLSLPPGFELPKEVSEDTYTGTAPYACAAPYSLVMMVAALLLTGRYLS